MLVADEDHAYLFLSLLQARVGGSLMRRLAGGDAGGLLDKTAPELACEMELGEKAARALAVLAEGFDAAAFLDRLARKGFRAVTYADEAYPARLRLAPDPPPALFVGGEMGEGLSVAVVGSRRATRSGLETAGVLGRALAAGGATVGVLGCGIDVTYPPKYKPARYYVSRLADGGDRGVASGVNTGRAYARGGCAVEGLPRISGVGLLRSSPTLNAKPTRDSQFERCPPTLTDVSCRTEIHLAISGNKGRFREVV